MLPALLGLAGSAVAGMFSKKKSAPATSGVIGSLAKTLSGGSKYRRRKKRLTNADIAELTMLKQVLGKTAAANALPFYLGRR